MTPSLILINPWIYDFAAYDLWSKPLGLLYLAGYLRARGFRIHLIDCLDIHHPGMGTDPSSQGPKRRAYGTGKFQREVITKPGPLEHVPRPYSRYGISRELFIKALKAIKRPAGILVTSLMTYWYPGVKEVIDLDAHLCEQDAATPPQTFLRCFILAVRQPQARRRRWSVQFTVLLAEPGLEQGPFSRSQSSQEIVTQVGSLLSRYLNIGTGSRSSDKPQVTPYTTPADALAEPVSDPIGDHDLEHSQQRPPGRVVPRRIAGVDLECVVHQILSLLRRRTQCPGMPVEAGRQLAPGERPWIGIGRVWHGPGLVRVVHVSYRPFQNRNSTPA